MSGVAPPLTHIQCKSAALLLLTFGKVSISPYQTVAWNLNAAVRDVRVQPCLTETKDAALTTCNPGVSSVTPAGPQACVPAAARVYTGLCPGSSTGLHRPVSRQQHGFTQACVPAAARVYTGLCPGSSTGLHRPVSRQQHGFTQRNQLLAAVNNAPTTAGGKVPKYKGQEK
ncbi:hypothetical protein D5F01_LYC15428 [Larimichthys crocea]|uniref:Uncharacterized protein n=1 Tax=Larimichthys crocea TaxID=215358 RepID=A0A6G0I2V9_LARCR|nr:hypothetical protein D5F01_LYC15428 [Larimichthys crocea]